MRHVPIRTIAFVVAVVIAIAVSAAALAGVLVTASDRCDRAPGPEGALVAPRR